MRAVVQRVKRASVTIDGTKTAEIGVGFLILLGVHETDTEADAAYLAKKCCGLRVFEDDNGKMNRSVQDVGGAFLVVSNFTLYGDCKKGNRPSFTSAARPETAVPLYEHFISCVRQSGIACQTGTFGADMQVELLNDGPVTLIVESVGDGA
ncbi:MAG TPA: D-tyrosyl-tRNA(Tyr) deacylase [Candidatus Aphodoplasma excrementigallinarum]|uniref:D-aminoacyl-tRNA deacylase n=1 Tax=Candidatus Aphodoplasma excrementigallinarum TaxID=2840673 RepID=A0A9D1NJ24_9FIRM|nr:D-tyrosyl-tRNA(Tyr) deacylase [Candidatus Aphodoplasma excrementigallinarum]